MSTASDIRVCFVGDSLVAGVGDPDHRGWVGRVAAHAAANGHWITTYNLGVRRETSADIAQRWAAECALRLPQSCRRHVVFSFGVNDTTAESGRTRVAAADSLDHLRRILGRVSDYDAAVMIGPAAVADADHNRRIQALDRQFGATCRELGVPYLSVFESLHANPIWMRQVAERDGAHPRAEGYSEFSKLVTGWTSWWFRNPSL